MRRNREPRRTWVSWRGRLGQKLQGENVNEQVGVGGGCCNFALSGGFFDPRVELRRAIARPYRASIRSIVLRACDYPPGASDRLSRPGLVSSNALDPFWAGASKGSLIRRLEKR